MSSQCEECGTQNIDDLNEEYNWCNSCLKNFNFLNFVVSINRFSDEKNEKIDDVIQEMQSKIKGPSDIIFEWIPYNQFNNISEEGKGDSAKACSAIWKDGPLTYSYFKKKLVRVSNKKVVLKYLFNSKDIKFLDEVKIYSINYSKNIYIYGISQDPSTKDYIIVLNAKALKKQIDDFNAEKRQKLEELIKEKTKDFEFNYFEYSKFSNLKGIGKEGFDMVKKAKTDNGIKVVLKAFIDENSKIENFISNFMKELELLHMVGYHDNINRFLGITKVDDIGNYFMVLKHANEGNLRDYLNKKFDSLQWENKIQMAFDITCGLKYLHSKGIIHRHLHSNNILANNDRLLISDFGLSNLMGNKTGIVEYIDPQCFKDIKYVRNEKSDIYSLGVLLWEITSGRPPFHNNNVLQDDMKRSNLQNYTGHMSFREEQIEGTPLEFRRLYEKCLDVDPEKRPDINQVYKEILNQSDDLYEEEWIKKKMKEEDICYFEYSKFSNFEEIGKGGFGVVKKAMTDDGNKVALKGLIENSKIGRNVIKTFVKELKNLRMVSHHDNINKFLGISKDHAGNYIMVLGYANEGNLRSYLKVKFDSLEWGDKIRMALDITCGLKCLHSKKIIHRDLHSKNILVNNGRLLIADFGLSKHLTDATSNSTGNRAGITEYIDPRCFRDFKYVRREKSDIYSLGILLWEITSGRPPFHDDNVSQAQDDSEQSNLRYHIGHLNLREKPIDGTPLEYQQLYQKCWDGDPEKRPDVNQVYNEIWCQYNADDIHEKHEDFSSSNSHDNLNISSDYSEPYLGSEFD